MKISGRATAWLNTSLSTRIAAYFGALFLFAIGTLFAFWFYGMPGLVGAGDQKLVEATRLLELSAEHQLGVIASNLDERRGDVMIIAENKVIAKQLETGDRAVKQDIVRVFERLQRAFPDRLERLLVVDPQNSRIVASSRAGDAGRLFWDPLLIQRLAQPGVAELIEQLQLPDSGPVIAIIRQIHALDREGVPTNRLVGILIATIAPQQVIGDGLRDNLPIASKTGTTLLFDPNGKLLAHTAGGSDNPVPFRINRQIATGFEGTLYDRDGQDGEWIVVYRHLQLSGSQGWRLVHYMSKDEALSGLQGQAGILAMTGVALTLLALLLITLAARRLSRPLRVLAEAARQFGAGDLSVRADCPRSASEVLTLAESFNEMAGRIEKAHQTLAGKVLERTAELAKERDAAQGYLDIAGVMLMALDRTARITMINKKGALLLGMPEASLIGLDWFEHFVATADTPALRQYFMRLMAGEVAGVDYYENRIVTAQGQELVMAWHNTLLRNAAGEVIGTLSSAEDITERKEAEERIKYLAHFDTLTGLPNRSQLEEWVRVAIQHGLHGKEAFALMFIDLDRFKDINDSLGHSIGDALLIELAQRLRRAVRDEDMVARLGGDEFVILLPHIDNHSAAATARKLLAVIAEPYRIEHYDLNVTGSIGIAIYPTDGIDLESLSKSADTAMYRAKREGRDNYCFFTAEMEASSARLLRMVSALHQAVEREQLQVHYQPQVDMAGHIIGAEALLRWTHPEMGPISPADFIPVAEDSGLILPIGEWVLHQAVRQARQWLDSGLPPLVMAVNLSAVQFHHADLPSLVTRILDEEGLPAEYLELELTEGVAMHDPQSAIAVMNDLHDRGIRMSIDDFGTGYSSLSYLKKFKVYKLKIDQSFVRDISTDPEDKAIVGAIISMAKRLGLGTIAEGVETAGQLDYLREQGCDEVQGYLFSRPLPAEQFAAFVRARLEAS